LGLHHFLARHGLQATAVLLLAVALAIAGLVIPAVAVDTFPGAMPQRAVAAFQVVLVFDVAACAALVLAQDFLRSQRLPARVCLGALSVATLIEAIALIDAAAAFLGHGSAMRWVSVLLFTGAAASGVVSIIHGALAMGRHARA
jgi:hypothetical protein